MNEPKVIVLSIVFVLEIVSAVCMKKDNMNTHEYLIFLCSIALAVTALVMIILIHFKIV